jgi:hypothetical protein
VEIRSSKRSRAGRATIALALIAATTATATVAASPANGAPVDQHCVGAAATGKQPLTAPVCFGSFAEAVRYATDGAVRLPAGATTVSQAELDRGYAAAGARVQTAVIGISFMNTAFTGASFTHTAAAGCVTGAAREWFFQLPTGWNDRISSAQSFSNCLARYWENGNGVTGSGASVVTNWSGGPMNDRATFVDFF